LAADLHERSAVPQLRSTGSRSSGVIPVHTLLRTAGIALRNRGSVPRQLKTVLRQVETALAPPQTWSFRPFLRCGETHPPLSPCTPCPQKERRRKKTPAEI